MPSPPTPALFELLYVAALAPYALYLVAEALGLRWRTWPLALGVTLHLVSLVARGVAIDFFPLTNKFESFYTFSFFAMAASLLAARSDSRLHRVATFIVGAIFYGLTTLFPSQVGYPPPLMQTIWYPLHVPASFAAYALWTSSAAAGLAVLLGHDVPRAIAAMESHAFWGFSIFSLSMIFGGAWGYVAWGAWFLWDPKVIWSVVLWLFFSAFVHLKYWPTGNRPKRKAALAVVGFFVMLVAYIGTSFLFSHSSHSF